MKKAIPERKYRKKKVILIIISIILILGLGYGINILIVAAIMWTLCKLGIILMWTWKQAALWAIILTIVCSLLSSIFKGDKKS